MALIQCEECGQMVSDKASECPHCGAPVEKKPIVPAQQTTVQQQQPEKQENKKNLVIMLLSIALIAIVVGIGLYFLLRGNDTNKGGEDIENNIESNKEVEQEIAVVSQKEPPSTINRHKYTDLEILGVAEGVRRIHISTNSEVMWEYYFDEKGMLTKCAVLDCGSDTYVFDGDKLVSSEAIWYEDYDSDKADRYSYKFSYKEENKNHSIIYRTKDGSDEKTKYADIFYDDEGRITSIERGQGNEHEKVKITYREDNMPVNDKGKNTVAKLELMGMPIINFDDFQLLNGQKYYNEALTIELNWE